MKDFKILAVNGQLGYGFPANVFYEGMKRKPDLVGVDGGSNDGGPYYLGSGASHCDSEAIKRDLRIVLPAVREAGIPFVIGSACTAGGNPHVDTALSIIRDVLDEMGWNAKIAVVRAEIPADFVRGKLRLGKVTPIDGAPPLTEKDIDESDRIVGQMGIEPVIRALDTGADIVLAGRACDTAVYAALPMRLGYDPALCQHASKVIECGAYCCSPAGAAESILAIIRENDFNAQPRQEGFASFGHRPLALRGAASQQVLRA